MTETVQQLKLQIGRLSTQERAELARYILAGLDDEHDDDQVAEAWRKEIDRRLDEIDAGKVIGIPADQLLRELREQYP